VYYGVRLSDPFNRLLRKSLKYNKRNRKLSSYYLAYNQSTYANNATRIAYTDCAAKIKVLSRFHRPPCFRHVFLTPSIFWPAVYWARINENSSWI
jgi:hypothetical protein